MQTSYNLLKIKMINIFLLFTEIQRREAIVDWILKLGFMMSIAQLSGLPITNPIPL